MAKNISSTIALNSLHSMNRWESHTLTKVYAAIFLVSVSFVYITYQAAQIIGRMNPDINAGLYFQAHLVTFFAEVVLWAIIARAAVHLKAYTRTISGSKDGEALNLIANAFLVSLLYAILFGMASTVKTLFWNTPYLDVATTVSNLLPTVAVVLFAIMLFKGSIGLIGLVFVKCQLFSSWKHFATVAGYVVAGGLYAWYLYQIAPSLVDDDGLRHFALSPPILFVVHIVPYLAVWLLGLLACINIGFYGRRVKGVVYKRLFNDVYRGLVVSFIGIFLAQVLYLTNWPSNRFGPGLLATVGVVLFLIYGCYLVNRGTSQLARIES